MDTGTHIVMGVALGGLATLDPAVHSDPTLFNAVLVGTIIGSHAPDFDTVLKLRNNATYIRHHRGITHSLPAIIFWGLFISGMIHLFVPEVNYLHLWAWTFLAVIIHVLVDIPNAYGTQAYRPFSNRWVAYGFINTFDPYIFTLHLAGIVAWVLGANPGITWLIIYTVILLYYIKRYIDKKEIVKKIHEFFPDTEQVATSPTMKQNFWRVAITTKDHFYVGIVENGHIEIIDEFEKIPLPNSEMIELACTDKNISAFLSFSPVYRWEINAYDDFTEVRFIDLRYRSKGYYPFVAVVQISDNKEIMSSYTGWIFSEHKLKRKLYVEDYSI
ncbi:MULTISPECIES: metal-dependent hydrolase [unclassified Virgibacillus]|uniref:metal-dependent hydrolase n=1 Tax=unclassified Virgibacillus TaxID=2620237 RepID=UPI0024DECF8A|nr:metal-dependent hydrolase [Virgibacillus sp. LDC-1]